jgi:hypothetical protein
MPATNCCPKSVRETHPSRRGLRRGTSCRLWRLVIARPGMAGRGAARQGEAWHGVTRRGAARQGKARL